MSNFPLYQNAESGASGATVTQGAAGNSGGTNAAPFDVVTIGANMTLTYDNTAANIGHGQKAFKIALTSTATTITHFDWTGMTGQARLYGAFYFSTNVASIAATVRFLGFYNSGTLAGYLGCVNTNQGFQWRSSADVALGTISGAITANTVYRVEFDITLGASGAGTATVYRNDTNTVVGSAAVFSATSFGTTCNEIRFGCLTAAFSSTSGNAFWVDDIQIGTNPLPIGPGPYPVAGVSGETPLLIALPVIPRGLFVPQTALIGKDTIAAANLFPITITDTGLSQTDVILSGRTRMIADTGLAQSDTISRGGTHAITITDTGLSQSDSIVQHKVFPRPIADSGLDTALTAGVTSYLTDTFTRTTGSGSWGTATTGTGWALPTTNPSGFSTDGASGLVTYAAATTYRIFAGQANADYEMRFQFSFPVATAATAAIQILPCVRSQSITDMLRAQILLGTGGALSVQAQQLVASTATSVGTGSGQNALNNGGYVANQVWNCGVRLQGLVLDAKIWKQGVAEPDWYAANSIGNYATDSTVFSTTGGLTGTATTWTTGDVGMHVNSAAGNTGVLTFDNITIQSIPADVLAPTFMAGAGGVFSRPITDSGLSQSDTILSARTRVLTDTGITQTDAILSARTHILTDTGLSQSDTITAAKLYARPFTDTGLSQSDTIVSKRTRSLADTGLAQSDTILTLRTRVLTDTGLTQSDSILTGGSHVTSITITDTGLSQSDSIVSGRTHKLTDTGLVQSDVILSARTHRLTDTGLAQSDTITASRLYARPFTDQGLSQSDQITVSIRRALTDTGTTQTDSLVRGFVRGRPITDTGITQSDTLRLVTRRFLTDQGINQTDSIIRTTTGTVSAVLVFFGYVSYPAPVRGRLPSLHGAYPDVLNVSTVRGRYTFSSKYTTGGETLTVPIQRPIVQVLPARLAGGKGITLNGTKLQAWNLDGAGNITTEVAANTDLTSVTVPIIAYVIAH